MEYYTACNYTTNTMEKAIVSGNINEVRRLLEEGADVNAAVDRYGMTPLHISSTDGHFEITELLLEYGADVTNDHPFGHTPLHMCYHTNVALIELLLKRGADVDAYAAFSWVPIHYHVGKDHLEVVELLLDYGADVNKRGGGEDTPLHISVTDNLFKMTKLLLRRGANPNVENFERKTPLHICCKNKNFQLAKLFVDHGALLECHDHSHRKEFEEYLAQLEQERLYTMAVLDGYAKHSEWFPADDIGSIVTKFLHY